MLSLVRAWARKKLGLEEGAPQVEINEPAPHFEPHEHVQCIRWQIAECPLAEGGVYRVLRVDENGGVHFNRCQRSHQARYFRRPADLVAAEPTLELYQHVQLGPDVILVDHVCQLRHGHVYRVNDRDDFNRITLGNHRGFYDGGCSRWHDPNLFTPVES